jgi:hypothetical protein
MSLSRMSYGLAYLIFQSMLAVFQSIIFSAGFFNNSTYFGKEKTMEYTFYTYLASLLLYLSQIPFAMAISTIFSNDKVA